MIHWSEPELVLECDEADGPAAQIYGAGVDLYEGLYLAMIWVYHEGTDGTIDTQLAVSRDGLSWTRVGDRAVWLALGDEDSWEGGMARSTERIINRGEELYIYYCGVHGPHGGPVVGTDIVRKHRTAIGLLTQRRDGFVSLDAGDEPGHVLTKAFPWPGGDLHLNVDAADGVVRAALHGESGRAIPGLDACEPIRGDHLDDQPRGKPGHPPPPVDRVEETDQLRPFDAAQGEGHERDRRGEPQREAEPRGQARPAGRRGGLVECVVHVRHVPSSSRGLSSATLPLQPGANQSRSCPSRRGGAVDAEGKGAYLTGFLGPGERGSGESS